MSILIKGMEMPANCKRCEFFTPFQNGFVIIGPLGHCDRLGKEVFYLENRLEDCPLVPVPPHGRLIDGDVAEVISFIDKDARGGDFADGVMYAVDFISELPTIIEAEPEVHDCDNCKWFGGLMCDHVDENYKCLGWEAGEDET